MSDLDEKVRNLISDYEKRLTECGKAIDEAREYGQYNRLSQQQMRYADITGFLQSLRDLLE